MLKTFGKEGKKEKKLAIDNEEFGEIGDAPPGDEAPRGRNKIYIEVKRIIDQKNKEYWSEDKVMMTLSCFKANTAIGKHVRRRLTRFWGPRRRGRVRRRL